LELAQIVQRVSYTGLLKACFIVFLPQLVVIFFAPSEFVVKYRLVIVTVNLIVSGSLGWKLYKHFFHLVFTYDDDKFSLRKGVVEDRSYSWADFEKLSIASLDYGEFVIRLYGRDGGKMDIPVQKLRLDPFKLRPEISRLLERGSQASMR
jgi:hypothetical protein